MKVAVIAHNGKTFGGGLRELREVLERRGVDQLRWREVPKSRKAPKQVRKALEWGAELVFVWGGDGMAQRSIDALAGSGVPVALLPAGTANLLATNLGIPREIGAAVDIGLAGDRLPMDIGRMNGEAFAVMAGAGFDARMIGDADGALKDRLGRLAYVWTGLRNLRATPFHATITVDGSPWFSGKVSCVLVGNVGRMFGGIEIFDGSRPDDGLLEVGVVTAAGAVQTIRTMARVVVGSADDAAHARTTKASSVRVKTKQKVPYELDGGARGTTRSLRVDVEPGGVVVCVPRTARGGGDGAPSTATVAGTGR